jgi:mannose-1-phosphate guanylyltransferase
VAKNSNFYPVILAGGRGTRFWPLSRKKRAKQLLALDGKQSMIQQTVARLLPLASAKKFWIIANEDLQAAIAKQLSKLPKAQILAEPLGRSGRVYIVARKSRCNHWNVSFRSRDWRRETLSRDAAAWD